MTKDVNTNPKKANIYKYISYIYMYRQRYRYRYIDIIRQDSKEKYC